MHGRVEIGKLPFVSGNLSHSDAGIVRTAITIIVPWQIRDRSLPAAHNEKPDPTRQTKGIPSLSGIDITRIVFRCIHRKLRIFFRLAGGGQLDCLPQTIDRRRRCISVCSTTFRRNAWRCTSPLVFRRIRAWDAFVNSSASFLRWSIISSTFASGAASVISLSRIFKNH